MREELKNLIKTGIIYPQDEYLESAKELQSWAKAQELTTLAAWSYYESESEAAMRYLAKVLALVSEHVDIVVLVAEVFGQFATRDPEEPRTRELEYSLGTLFGALQSQVEGCVVDLSNQRPSLRNSGRPLFSDL